MEFRLNSHHPPADLPSFHLQKRKQSRANVSSHTGSTIYPHNFSLKNENKVGKRCENGRIPNEKKRREEEEKKKKRSWYKHFSVDRASPGIFSRPFARFNPLFEAAPHPSAYRYSSGAISPGHFSISSDEFPVPLSLPATSTRLSIYTANSPEHKSSKFLLFNVLFFLFEGGQQPRGTYQTLTRRRERGRKLDETKFLT